MPVRTYKLSEVAVAIGAELRGDPNCVINGIATIQNAQAGQLTFLSNVKYRKYLADTKASAVIISKQQADDCPVNALLVSNSHLGYAKAAALFDDAPAAKSGIHPTAIIDKSATIPPSVSIGAHCAIGAGVSIGENVVIDSNCSIGANAKIGADSKIWPNVVIYHNVKIGERAVIHGGTVIGSDGFSFAQDKGTWLKIPQIGTVVIGNDVEIGANTAIDRGAIEDTVIADGVKIDNLVQIAHNVTIGAHTAIAGCVGIAGSTSIGMHCAIGGGVGIAGHIEITDGVILTGGSLVGQSITEPGVYMSGTPAQPALGWKKTLVRLTQLDDMTRRIRELERNLEKVTNTEA